jgi:hypothetical protein
VFGRLQVRSTVDFGVGSCFVLRCSLEGFIDGERGDEYF